MSRGFHSGTGKVSSFVHGNSLSVINLPHSGIILLHVDWSSNPFLANNQIEIVENRSLAKVQGYTHDFQQVAPLLMPTIRNSVRNSPQGPAPGLNGAKIRNVGMFFVPEGRAIVAWHEVPGTAPP
jgi:hypothetical protein